MNEYITNILTISSIKNIFNKFVNKIRVWLVKIIKKKKIIKSIFNGNLEYLIKNHIIILIIKFNINNWTKRNSFKLINEMLLKVIHT